MKAYDLIVIGPNASLPIQEIITLMYTKEKTVFPITTGMHIHPPNIL